MKDFSSWGIKQRKFPELNYNAVWHNLQTLRLGVGVAKELPPLSSEFYDISLGTKCNTCCPFCYKSSSKDGELYTNIVDKVKLLFENMLENDKPFQVAIGSEGEPTIHPEFLTFLETIYKLGIVPNYTTNGITIANNDRYSKKLLYYTEKYCGGVAVSANNWCDSIDATWRNAVYKLSKIDTNINLHYIISDKSSVKRFVDIYDEFKDKVLYFVLLPLMSTGRSDQKYTTEAFQYLLDLNLDFSNIAFGAHFYDDLKDQEKLSCYLYPPESFSKNIILSDIIKITPSSFVETPLITIPYDK